MSQVPKASSFGVCNRRFFVRVSIVSKAMVSCTASHDIALITSAGVAALFFSRSWHATPAAAGLAIEVPERVDMPSLSQLSIFLVHADTISVPGAVISIHCP
jgi:urease alpha subunit